MKSTRMPVLFLGHGNPMHAIADNQFTRTLARLGGELPRPKRILCVSAHWMTEGSWITHQGQPKTIHDFYGFPQALFDVQYLAKGDPAFAEHVSRLITDPQVQLDDEMWGYDHGTWSVLKHMYPQADVPVLQLSIYMSQPAQYHWQLGEQLRPLRDQGVLIVGSGNIVHNLRRADLRGPTPPYDWAIAFDAWVKQRLENREFEQIVQHATDSEEGRLSIPTPDHWYPLLYVIGAAGEGDQLRFEYEGLENASISMRSFSFGR